jgi:flagellar basal body-associated protein FliL
MLKKPTPESDHPAENPDDPEKEKKKKDKAASKKIKVSLPALLAMVKHMSRRMLVIALTTLAAIIVALIAVHHASAKSHVKKPIEHGPVITLDEFLVNLADETGDHYLKVTVAVEIDPATGKTAETLKEQVPIIRDAVLTAITSKTRDQVDSEQGRENLKAEIKDGVNRAIGEPVIRQVYFTNFVTQ